MATVAHASQRLTTVLASLNAKPRLTLPRVKSLQLTYASRNDHFGARHFAKEDLPRISYANPTIDIRLNAVRKLKGQDWKPEMVVEFEDGRTHTLSMQSKYSNTILADLLTLAESDAATTVPPTPTPARVPKHFAKTPELSYDEFCERNPRVVARMQADLVKQREKRKERRERRKQKAVERAKQEEEGVQAQDAGAKQAGVVQEVEAQGTTTKTTV